MGPVRQALRTATREVHDRLDRAPLLAPLTGGELTLEQYRAALSRLWGFHAPVERALGRNGGRLALLRADLADLGVEASSLPEAGGLPALDGEPARLAACYVLDGSAHGGRAMLPVVERVLRFDAGRGARFLASAGIDTVGEWKALLLRLEEELADPERRQAACEAAVALFEVLERWVSEGC